MLTHSLKFTCESCIFFLYSSSSLHVLEYTADTTQRYYSASHSLALLFKKVFPSCAVLHTSRQCSYVGSSGSCGHLSIKTKWVFIVVVAVYLFVSFAVRCVLNLID